MKNTGYRVYGRSIAMKKWLPIGEDIEGDFGLVSNLLCAFLYFSKTDAQKTLDEMRRKNPGLSWEIRPVKIEN